MLPVGGRLEIVCGPGGGGMVPECMVAPQYNKLVGCLLQMDTLYICTRQCARRRWERCRRRQGACPVHYV
jgi:hypothetical protein